MVHRSDRIAGPGRLWPWGEMELMLEHMFSCPRTHPPRSWRPDIDVFETEVEYVILVDVPGLDAERIDLRLEGRTLTLVGERPPALSVGGFCHVQERPSGRFERRVTLPAPVDPSHIEARCKDGVLEVRIPKSAR